MAEFDDLFTEADSLLAESFGGDVTYYRGSLSVTLTAEVVTQDYPMRDDEGFPQIVRMRQYLIDSADLVLGGSQVDPQPFDQITQVVGGATRTFTVFPLGDRPCFDWADELGHKLIVNTKRVS